MSARTARGVAWLALFGATSLASCRLIAGYEEIELVAVTSIPSGGTGGTGAVGGTGGQGGDTSDGGTGGSGGSVPSVTIATLTATPNRTIGARDVELAWEVEEATHCSFNQGLGDAEPYWGTRIVSPAATTTYTLTCEGPGGPVSEDVTVTVLSVALSGGGAFTCALTNSGSLKCFGDNAVGQLGQGDTDDRGDSGGEMGDALLGIALGQGHYALRVAVGSAHVCAMLDDNNVKCWGANAYGQLGLEDTDDRGDGADEMGDALEWVSVGGTEALALGGNHSCALLLTGAVKCWGNNAVGQLGQGDTADRGPTAGSMAGLDPIDLGTGRTATAIAAGNTHTCALLDDQTVKCWGGNEYGQLGKERVDPLGDDSNEMGDALTAIDFGLGIAPVAIAAGGNHSCALFDDDSVRCWGLNADGQLGLGNTTNYGSAGGTMGTSLPAVSLGAGVHARAIAAGGAHTCAITSADLLKCWGLNANGQLGLGDTNSRGDGAAEMGDDLLPVNLGAQRTVEAVALGATHTCAVIDDGTVRCWGANASGELGLGDTTDRGTAAGQMGESLPTVDLTP